MVTISNNRSIAEQIFMAGVESVIPAGLITNVLILKDNILLIGDLSFSLELIDNIYVIGAGKASAIMAAEVEKILGKLVSGGHIAVKHGHSTKLKYIKVTEAGHPVPDLNSFKATEAILEIAGRAEKDDLVICLLSGGGSALLSDFPVGSSPEEMMALNDLLVNSGATIREINAVRKHLSIVKGGNLARRIFPATLVSLILSDVPGNPLDVIASGPTSPDPTTFQQAITVIEQFDLEESVPAELFKYLRDGAAGLIQETPKPDDAAFSNTHNLLIGTNSIALEAAKLKALEFNINPVIIDDQLQGDVISVAEYIVQTALKFKDDPNEVKPVCLLFGGETTVVMTGNGLGGRNQHLAMLCATLLQNQPDITILSAGTDGTDGPTDATGAVVDSDTLSIAKSKNVDIQKYIDDFDSYRFFKKVGGQIITGPTMTNVMDIIVVIVV